MKELSIEEKAKAYDEALSVAQETYTTQPMYRDWLEKMFPELKESEDERIRKELISFFTERAKYTEDSTFNGLSSKEIIAWLEKQGEQNHANSTKTCKGEQKSIDMVEPKFHEGEWVTNGIETVQITGYDIDYGYQVDYKGNLQHRDTDIIEKVYHLWTIQDAKSGDVLASNSSTFLFSQEYMGGKPEAHCGIMNGFFIAKPEGCWTNEKIYPATKEQRYFLFTKIREAGYKWDDGKKKLEKIEQKFTDKTKSTVNNYITPNKQFFQWIYDRLINVHKENPNVDYMLSLKERIENMQKPTWSKKDAEMVEGLNNCLDELEEENDWKYVYVKDKNVELAEIRNWLKLLKERVACEANCTTTKEWSEEEESIINKAESWLDTLCDYLKDSSPEYISDIKDVINKLKSIKDRYTWKPSEEQMDALDSTLQYSQVSHNSFEYLNSLYNDLKQL